MLPGSIASCLTLAQERGRSKTVRKLLQFAVANRRGAGAPAIWACAALQKRVEQILAGTSLLKGLYEDYGQLGKGEIDGYLGNRG